MNPSPDEPRSPAWRGLSIVLVAALALGALVIYAKRPGSQGAVKPFAVTDLEGKSWRLEDHRGRVVMVNIWATWCPPCRAETPDLVAIANEFAPAGLDTVGLSVDRSNAEAAVRSFARDQKIPYPLAITTADQLPVQTDTIPVTLLIDRQGQLSRRFDGAVSAAEVRGEIRRLLAQ